MALSNATVRLTTAAIVTPLLLVLLFVGPTWGWFLLILAACLLAALEVQSMIHPEDVPARWLGAVITAATMTLAYGCAEQPAALLAGLSLVPVAGLLVPLWRLGSIPTAALRLTGNVAVAFYLGLPLATLALIRRDFSELGPRLVVMVLTFAWWGDSGAYFVGRRFGRRPLYAAISPKKTREGFFGAIGGAVLAGLVAHFWYLPVIPLGHALLLGALCGALGQLGDLAESLLKRSTGIKDSGQLVPGHGGVLDRIDALLFVSPVVYGYLCATLTSAG